LTDQVDSAQYFEILQMGEPDCYDKIKAMALRVEKLQKLRNSMMNSYQSCSSATYPRNIVANIDTPKLPSALSSVPRKNAESSWQRFSNHNMILPSIQLQETGDRGEKINSGVAFVNSVGRVIESSKLPTTLSSVPRTNAGSGRQRLSDHNKTLPSLQLEETGSRGEKKKSDVGVTTSTGRVKGQLKWQGCDTRRHLKRNGPENVMPVAKPHTYVKHEQIKCYSCHGFGHTRQFCAVKWDVEKVYRNDHNSVSSPSQSYSRRPYYNGNSTMERRLREEEEKFALRNK
jgi:hypothetical protein